jgi:hypothetical protein
LTVTAIILGLVLGLAGDVPPSNGLLRDGFEGPEFRWGEPQGRGAFRVERHEISRLDRHDGAASETISVAAAGQSPIYFHYPLAGARVIDELAARLWIRSNRPQVQLWARVVLPRSRDVAGLPITTLLGGASYRAVGSWQELAIEGLPQLLEQSARALRVQHGPSIDTREAYVDRLVLSIPPAAGIATLWVDDLQVAGLVDSGAPRPSVNTVANIQSAQPPPAPARRPPQVRLNGPSILVADAPFFPRAIAYRGEPLDFLKGLGFNTLLLGGPPTAEMAAAALRLDLWFICPPPADDTLGAALTSGAAAPSVLGRQYDRVLVWNLGEGLTGAQLDAVKASAELIRVRDREFSRPLVCQPLTDLRSYSRACDVLVMSRSPIGSSLELPRYLSWLRERPQLAHPGTPIWATVQTEPIPELAEQIRRFSSGRVTQTPLQSEQIRLAAYTAIAGGARGLLFDSRTRLDDPSPASRHRARTLELINLELSLVERWAATGNFTMTVPGSDPEALAAVFESSHARVLLPLWSGRGAQFVPGQLAGTNVSFTVPGVPESSSAYEITFADLPMPRHKRVAGGTRVTLDEFGLTSIVLLTGDAVAVQHVSQRLAAISDRAAMLEFELASERWGLVNEIHSRLVAQRLNVPKSAEYLSLAGRYLNEADGHLQAGRFPAAATAAQRAVRPLRLIERAHWDALVKPLASPLVNPLATTFVSLPELPASQAFLGRSQFISAGLLGGDFEQLGVLDQSGWQHVRYEERGIKTGAELSAVEPRLGRYSLRLWAQPLDPAAPPVVVESPPVWVTSPGVQVAAGELLKIHGWVRAPGIAGSVDGLMIIDSIGGPALAQRVDAAPTWQEFVVYRVATDSRPVSVQFALTGLGQVWIDDVAIERLGRPQDLVRSRLPQPPGR